MADTDKLLTELNEETNPSVDAMMYIVDTPTTSPAHRRTPITAAYRAGGGLEALTMDKIFYVAITGDNANDGTLESPWANIQYAVDYVARKINLNGHDVTIQLGNGTYGFVGYSPYNVALWAPFVGNGLVTIAGNPLDPTAVIIRGSNRRDYKWSGTAVYVSGGASLGLKNLTVYRGDASYGGQVWADSGGTVFLTNVKIDGYGTSLRATESSQIIILSGFYFKWAYGNDTHILLENGSVLSFNYANDGIPKTVTGYAWNIYAYNSTLDFRGVTFTTLAADAYYMTLVNSTLITDNPSFEGPVGSLGPCTWYDSIITRGKDPTYSNTVLTDTTADGSAIFTIPNRVAHVLYEFKAVLFTTSDSGGGVKVILDTPTVMNEMSVSSMVYNGTSLLARSRFTTADPTLVATTALTDATIEITGTIRFSDWADTDTLTLTVSQNVGHATPTMVLAGSYFEILMPQYAY